MLNENKQNDLLTLQQEQIERYKVSCEELGAYKLINEIMKQIRVTRRLDHIQSKDETLDELVSYLSYVNVHSIIER